ncbi:hypothetical protein [Pseudomonas sp. UFMG81]|jgi:hypothetical protein|uniref:hypothetical protein n=1 Tax=Pseudomonas sp. UFMG81 TaxID=2745936 RepID=UPI00188EBA1E|nr:hypothetical protein [Pseudomonas sp. UFMG81]
MNVSHRSNTTEGPALILNQRTSIRGNGAGLIVEQASLAKGDEQGQLVLRRYFEHYSPAHSEWVEYSHTVTASELIHWMMAKGRLHIEHSAQGAAPAAQGERP